MRLPRNSNWVMCGGLVLSLAALIAFGSNLRQATPIRVANGNAVRSSASVPVSDAASAAVAAHYDRLPLAFEPNRLQANPQVQFLARGIGYTLFLTPEESVLALSRPSKAAGMLRVKFAGSNVNARFSGLDELPGKTNYIVGKCPENWHTNIPTYRKVARRDIYPGIDVIYYGTQRQLEYDFVVSPGALPRAIELDFQGAENLRTDSVGDLLVKVAGGEVRMQRPLAYQQADGTKHAIAASYIVKHSNRVSFQLAQYDARLPLVIDPTLAYSTYLGGSNIDDANAIAVAPDATAFIAGGTFSADFPTAHPLQPNVGGPRDFPQDAFVAKISADGASLLYSTFLGGSGADVANGIAVDTFGDAYVTGTTLSIDFPVTPGSFNTICGSDGKCGASFNQNGLIVSNAFVTKLNPAGSALIYSAYLGEYENVRGQAIALDNDQNAYVTGQTGPNGVPSVSPPPVLPPAPFPITGTAFQPSFGGGASDVFVAKISATGTSIQYSSYLGGNNEDVGNGIAIDSNAVAYVTGLTYSTNFPAVAAIQGAPGGAGDAFVAKINTRASGAAGLLYSTNLGGAGLDQGNGIAVDNLGNAYVAGASGSNSFAFTPSGFQTANHGEGDAFVAKLTPVGALSYFTFMGGALADSGAGVAVDTTGNAYVTGSTVSPDFPITSPVFQHSYGGGNADAFVAKLNPTGTSLVYSSFLGGSNTELPGGIAIDTNGSAYVAGQTCSQDFPLSDPLQSSAGGNCDAFISKISPQGGIAINPGGLVFLPQTAGTTSSPQTVTLTNNDVTPITVTSIFLSASNTGDFVQTNTCSAPLPAGGQCTITVTFHPSTVGASTASLKIVDSAPGSPHFVVLSGTGIVQNPDFTISATPSSATVSAGDNAAYKLTISPLAGFTQQITLNCAGLPRGASCSFSQNPITTPVGTPVAVTVSVNTALRTLVPPILRKFNLPETLRALARVQWLTIVVFFALGTFAAMRRRPAAAVFGLATVLLLVSAGCGGGSAAGVPAGTPAGTSQFSVSATSGSLVHTTVLTLQVN